MSLKMVMDCRILKEILVMAKKGGVAWKDKTIGERIDK